MILPYRPLPHCRTQRITVPLPLMLYFRCTASTQNSPASTSRTACILKALLYRITFMVLGFSLSKVPTYFRTGPPPSPLNPQPSTLNRLNPPQRLESTLNHH